MRILKDVPILSSSANGDQKVLPGQDEVETGPPSHSSRQGAARKLGRQAGRWGSTVPVKTSRRRGKGFVLSLCVSLDQSKWPRLLRRFLPRRTSASLPLSAPSTCTSACTTCTFTPHTHFADRPSAATTCDCLPLCASASRESRTPSIGCTILQFSCARSAIPSASVSALR